MGGNVLRTNVYDANPDDPSYSQHTVGRLAEIKYPAITYQTFPGDHDSTTMFTDMFSYHPAGAVTGKRLRVTKTNPYENALHQWLSQPGQGDLNMVYAYDNEGKPYQITYPTDASSFTPTYNYTYDAMARLSGMTGNDGGYVNNVSYGAANELKTINYYGATETRSYNSLFQMTNITAAVGAISKINQTYNFPGAGYANVAVNKPATQSSTLGGYGPSTAASSAVDGNTDGNFSHGSVTHTNNNANAWWQVDLGYSAAVSSIVVWNRTDCCGDRLSDYWVFVSDTPFNPNDTPATLQNRPGTWSSHQTTQPNPSATISIPGAQGRYVRVQLSGTNWLSLAEVQVFSLAGANNGKIYSVTDNLSAETVLYQYDSLNRLISAAGSGWTQTQTCDGFGNLTQRTGTGSAASTTMTTAVNASTNRLSGYTYDANGNQLSNSAAYDAENRIVQANSGLIMYGYDAQNKRIWQGTCTLGINCGQGVINVDTVTMFGADGRQAGTFAPQVTWTNNSQQVAITFTVVSRRAYFGGKLVGQYNPGLGANTLPAVQDRLGSVGKYYPYGEERNSPPLINDQVKFATYTRDSGTGLDYADQRYYASTFGRFMTVDPSPSSNALTLPGNWNPYSYVGGDAINKTDPMGLCSPEDEPPCYSVTVTKSSGPQPVTDPYFNAENPGNGGQDPSTGVVYLYIEPHFPSPPALPWYSDPQYWAYASCFTTGILGAVMQHPEVPGVSVWGIIQGLITGAAWGSGAAIVGGVALSIDLLAKADSVARGCARATGYTPWILQQQIPAPPISAPPISRH